MTALESLHIIPGRNCNLQCSHCVNSSGPGGGLNLSKAEIDNLIQTINNNPIKELLFTGGEPTLYIPTLNQILEKCTNLGNIKVIITTNGKYAISEESIGKVLNRIKKISHIQLSYDTFHGSDQSPQKAKNLESYCNKMGYTFSISVCISDPSQLLQIGPLSKELEANITFQKVEASGRAKSQNTQYKYFEFSPEVLSMKCPNLDVVTFIPEKGFTHCCSNLVFNGEDTNQYAFKTIEKYFESEFHNTIANNSFGEMLEKKKISTKDLQAKYSSPCTLCEDLHRGRVSCNA